MHMTSSVIDPCFPLVDLHHHLDGSVRLETILDLGLQYNLPLPARTLEGLRPFVQVSENQPGVMAFIEKFEWMTRILVDEQACWRVAYENVEDAARDGLDYVEMRYSPWFMAEANTLDPVAVIDAVTDGLHEGERDFGVKVNQIGILSRHYGREIAQLELAMILSRRDAFTGLDLAGDEANYPGELFVEHFKTARDAGLHITVHAGEAAGPRSIWQALEELGAERIGHAVHAPEDANLIAHLREKRIGLELNLTSNVQTSTVPSYIAHPARYFMEEGLLAGLNTDDPGISAIDLHYEFEVAGPLAGLSPEQLRQMQINALEMAFLTDAEKKALMDTAKQREKR